MPLRQLTFHEEWVIQQAYNRLQITPTIPNPASDIYLRLDNVQGKGWGYLARRNITRGTRILEESPFLWLRRSKNDSEDQELVGSIRRKLRALPKASKALF